MSGNPLYIYSAVKTAKPVTKSIAIILVAILALGAVILVHFYGAQFWGFGLMAEHFLPGIVSSQSYKRAVMNPKRDDAYSAYGILGARKSPEAREIALQQIHSDDDYLWMNAAHYLGCIDEHAAIPYLIKALRHTAWRSDEKRRELLVVMTGQDFGTDFAKWRNWWMSQRPSSEIDWESHLGFNPRITGPHGPANESQPHRSATNQTSPAADSRR